MIKRFFYLLTLLSLAFGTQGFASPEGLLKGFDGTPHQLEAYTGKGKWLVVVIWASDCHICDKEMPAYEAFHRKHAAKDAEVLGISMDGEERQLDAEQFIEDHGMSFTNLIAEPGPLMRYYAMLTQSNFVGTPTLLLYSPDGKLRAAQAGAVPVKVIEDYIARETDASVGRSE